MKFNAKFAVPGFLLLFSCLSFAQSDAKARKTPPKASAAPSAAPANSQAKPERSKQTAPAAAKGMFPAVVAKVNGDEILGSDLEELVRAELNVIGNPEWNKLRGEYRSELTLGRMNLLINSKLLYQQAAAAGTKATDAEVQAELDQIKKSYKSEAEMMESLARQNMDLSSLKKSVSENLTTSKYVEREIGKDFPVSEEELAKYYSGNSDEFRHPDIVRTSHILIRPAGDSLEQDAAAKKQAEGIYARIKKGEDFAKLARENSADSSASRGGDVGFTARESLPPEYADAAFSLPVGEIRIVRTPIGYHIMKVVDRKSQGTYSLEDVKQQLTDFLKNQKYQEQLNKLIERIREKAKIEILITAKEILNS